MNELPGDAAGAIERLLTLGWSPRLLQTAGPTRVRWTVAARRGDATIHATAASQVGAWRRAVAQAEAVGAEPERAAGLRCAVCSEAVDSGSAFYEDGEWICWHCAGGP